MGVQIIVERQADLLEIVAALSPARRLAGLLNSGKEQRDQDGDNCNHNKQFNQCEGAAAKRHFYISVIFLIDQKLNSG